MSEFDHHIGKLTTFELFRKVLNNVEISTYDELLERAKFILGHNIKKVQTDEEDHEEDLPF